MAKVYLQKKKCIGCGLEFTRKQKGRNFKRDKCCTAKCRYLHLIGSKAPNYRHGLFIKGNKDGWREGKRLAENKRRAQGAGYFNHAKWENIKAMFGYRCRLCRRSNVNLTIDHRIPISKGGKHDETNIQPLCQSCNSKKRDKFIWREKDWFSGKQINYYLGTERINPPLGERSSNELKPGVHMN